MATGTLTSSTIAATYKSLMKVKGGANAVLHATTHALLEDGDGNDSVLSLAIDSVGITGSGAKLYFHDKGDEYISAAGGDLTIAAGTALNITADIIDLSDATKDITLINSADALNFDSNTLSIDALNNRIGIGTAAPGHSLEISVDAAEHLRLRRDSGAYWDVVVGADGTGDNLLSIQKDGSYDNLCIEGGGKIGMGVNSPLGTLHIESASAGSIAPIVDADDLVIENSGHCGITIYSGTTHTGNIFFGDSGDDDSGRIVYDHNVGTGKFEFHANGGTEQMTILNSGFVGINNPTPLSFLHLASNTGGGSPGFILANHVADAEGATVKFRKSRNTTINDASTVPNDDDEVGVISWEVADTNSFERIAAIKAFADGTVSNGDAPGRLEFQTTLDGASASATHMTLINDGRFGIGTAIPKKKLSIAHSASTEGLAVLRVDSDGIVGNGSTIGNIWFGTSDNSGAERYGASIYAMADGNWADGSDYNSKLVFLTTSDSEVAPSVKMQISEAGNVGIGTATARKFQVNHSSDALSEGDGCFAFFAVSDYGSSQNIFGHRQDNNTITVNEGGVDLDFRVESAVHDHSFFVRGTDGYVGMGASSSPSSLCHIKQSNDVINATANVLHVEYSRDGVDAGDVLVRLDFSDDSDVDFAEAKFISFHDKEGEIGYIAAASASTMHTAIQTSDVRLKTDIKDSSLEGLSIINALKLRDFKWNNKAKKNAIGIQETNKWVADEVYEVYPQAVLGTPGRMRTEVTAAVEAVVGVEAVLAKDAVYETVTKQRQKVVITEVAKEETSTEIVLEGGKYVQKTTTKTVTREVSTPQYEEVKLYDEDGEEIGTHQIEVMEDYQEEVLVSEAIEAIEAIEAVDAAPEKSEEIMNPMGIANTEFIAPLIKAIQELSAKVTTLENA